MEVTYMGSTLLTLYKEKFKSTWKIAFVSSLIVFFLVHMFKIANTFPNHDSYFNVYNDQDMTVSGRWFLQYACGISSYFDLAWVNGLLCALWLCATNIVITELFALKNPVVICLTSAIIVACPATTETLFFGFTADGYLLGLALAALSACLSCCARHWLHFAWSGICLCLCCAIYQSCVSFSVVLCICWLVMELLENRISVRDAWCWIGKHVLLYAASLAAYYLIWKLLLSIRGIEAVSYQGIDAVGQIEFATLLSGAVKSLTNLFFLFLEWNILEHPITLYGVLNIGFLICFAGIIVTAFIRSGCFRRPGAWMVALIALAASVPIISVWCFLSDGVQYRPMMMHSAVLYYVLAVILFDRWTDVKRSTAFGLLMCVIVYNFSVMANISYGHLDKCRERTYYEGIQMMDTIDTALNQSDACPAAVAFIGSRALEVSFTEEDPASSVHILNQLLEKSLLFDHHHIYPYLTSTFGLTLPSASGTFMTELTNSGMIDSLAVWPEDGCCTIIDDILVINLG